MKWKGDPNTEEKHRHDYRWIKNKKERKKWIEEHYELPKTMKNES